MRQRPDYTWTVKLWGDPGLNDEGWETLSDALMDITPEDVLWEALTVALRARLPKPHRERPELEWFICRVDETAPTATPATTGGPHDG